MRNLLIWDKLFNLTDAVSRSEFEELVETKCDEGVTFFCKRGRVYVRLVSADVIKTYGSVIEVGYVLDKEVSAMDAWDLIHNELIYKQDKQ